MLNYELLYHRLDVTLTASKDTWFDAWVGAVLRNNLLYATEQIRLPDRDMALFGLCRQFPLSVHHPLYKELKDGFPAPYYLFVREPEAISLTHLESGSTISFSLALIGEISQYTGYFIDALEYMCHKGMGMYSKPFVLSEIREVSAEGENQVIFKRGATLSDRLLFPFDMKTMEKDQESFSSDGCIRITFESPVCLIKQRKRSEAPGYQEMSNLFPGFYQIVRTAAYRLEKLHALYVAPDDVDSYNRSHEKMEKFLEPAAWLQIESINLKRADLQSSRRKRHDDPRIPLTGLTGDLTFRGNYKPYVTLLKYMEHLGIGHALTYGFGKYKIELL
jgi:hypothetical protein